MQKVEEQTSLLIEREQVLTLKQENLCQIMSQKQQLLLKL